VPPRPIDLTSTAALTALREGVRNAAALAVVAAVAIAAAASAVFGAHPAPVAATHSRPAPIPPPPPPRALRGELWYADHACRVHRIDLQTGRDRTLTVSDGHCNFWVSPNRRLVAIRSGRPIVPPRPLALLDVRTGRITTPFRGPDLGFAPPAWSPDSRTLVMCDGSHGIPELRAFHVPGGRVTTPVPDACFPAYVGDRLAYRDIDGVTHIGRRHVTGAGALASLLKRGVEQNPGPAAAGGVLAVPATTVTIAGGPAPITIVVIYDREGRAIGQWDMGAAADTVTVLGGGRVIAASRREGVELDDRRTGIIVTSAARRPIVAAAVSPGQPMLALSNGREVVFTTMTGRARWSLPLHTRWLQWTP
jgi:hypothetical protein